MILNRRTLIFGAAAQPLFSQMSTRATPDQMSSDRVKEILYPSVLDLSPDGNILLQRTERNSLVFRDVDTLNIIAETPPDETFRHVDIISWSPSSQSVALAFDSNHVESDVFLIDVATAKITNLTPEGTNPEIDRILYSDPHRLDQAPLWLANGRQIVFDRQPINLDGESRALFCYDLESKEVTPWSDSPKGETNSIRRSRLFDLQDGSVVYSAGRDDEPYSLLRAVQGGSIEPMPTDGLVSAFVTGINPTGTSLVLWGSIQEDTAETYWLYDVATTSVIESLDATLDSATFASAPMLYDDPTEYAYLYTSGNSLQVRMVTGDSVEEIADLRAFSIYPESHSVQRGRNRLLVAFESAAAIINLESVSES